MRINEKTIPENLTGPLKGIKIVDFSHVMAGPYASSLLSDLGADVVKLERAEGDTTRRYGPLRNGESGYYIQINKGKRNLCVDLTTPEAHEIIKKMVQESDVVLENFAFGGMDRLGFGYEQLKEWNPQIIMCSISINGQSGPEVNQPGFDIVAQARGGLIGINGFPDTPTKVAVSIGDMTCGANAVIGILAALHERNSSGLGQHIDVALSDSVLKVNEWALPYYFMNGTIPPRSGNAHTSGGPYSIFKTADGFLIIACVTDAIWDRFLDATGHHEWKEDPRYATNIQRGHNRYELQDDIEAWLAQFTTKEAVAHLDKYRVPNSPVFTFEDIAENEQFKHRDMLVTLEQPNAGDVVIAGNIFHFSRTPSKVQGRASLIGEDNEDVLQRLGYDAQNIQALYDKGVIKKP